MYKEVADILKEAQKILIFTHLHPDGDALGSTVALKKAMESIGKKADVILERPLSPVFQCFGDEFILRDNLSDEYDLKVSLDCGDYDRLGKIKDLFSGKTVNIDHHSSNTFFAEINYVDGESAATGEIVFSLIKYMGIDITKEIADAIYGAILTDTGGFMFSNTGAKSHIVAAELIEKGADYYALNKKLMQEKEYHRHLITAHCIENMEFYKDGKVCVSVFTNETASEIGMTLDDTNGLSAVPRTVKGVEVGVLITEIVKGTVKVSLRSDSIVNVSEIAAKFGGGGHIRASGITLKDKDINTVKEELIKEIIMSF